MVEIMRKACIAFGSLTVALFIGYTAVAATAGSFWYVAALWIAFVATGILFLSTGSAYLCLLYKKHRNPLDILDDWQCTYWPSQNQLKVTLWFRDRSDASAFSVKCIARFGQQKVNMDDIDGDVTIGGTYIGKAGLISGRNQPMMMELLKRNVELRDASTATILTRIKPLGGVWGAKQQTKLVEVQVIKR